MLASYWNQKLPLKQSASVRADLRSKRGESCYSECPNHWGSVAVPGFRGPRLGTGVLEIVSDYRGDAFRAVYFVRLANKVYVLHAFQKKSKSGIATPKPDIELVKHRLKRAFQLHLEEGN